MRERIFHIFPPHQNFSRSSSFYMVKIVHESFGEIQTEKCLSSLPFEFQMAVIRARANLIAAIS